MGTWKSSEKEVYDAVLVALKSGYRHIDTAAAYGNEDAIGRAIEDSGIERNEIFVTTKLWCTDHRRPREALKESLRKLRLSFVDLYLMHWPVPLNPNGNGYFPTLPNGKRDIDTEWDFIKTWDLLQELVAEGLTKSVGVSNFSVKSLKKLLASPSLKIKPVANQVELHPYLPQHKLLKYATENGILLEAYSPLGSTGSTILSDDTVVKLAEKLKVSPATLLISWAVWRNTVVLPKSVTPSRIESNLSIIDLSDEDGEILNGLSAKKGNVRFVDPDWSPFVVFDDDDY